MKKSNFIALILGTIGTVFFALGIIGRRFIDSIGNFLLLFFVQIFGLIVRTIFIQSGQIDIVALCPQLFGFCSPLSAQKAGHLNLAQRIFLWKNPVLQNLGNSIGILTIEQKIIAQLKTD